MNILSLGAGVQSSVLAIMIEEGLVPMVSGAIFADVGGWESPAVYAHLDWLETQLSYPVYRVSHGDLRGNYIKSVQGGPRAASIPVFTSSGGVIMRQCTTDYKINPIRKKLRELLGVEPGKRVPKNQHVTQYIGISIDEAARMKPSRDKWVTNTWPLIDHSMSRADCLKFFADRYPTRTLCKSSCIGCPYHSDSVWRDMKLNDPASFADAVDFDKQIRTPKNLTDQLFLHRSRKPLDEVDFRNLEDMGQLNMFNDECEGMCGI